MIDQADMNYMTDQNSDTSESLIGKYQELLNDPPRTWVTGSMLPNGHRLLGQTHRHSDERTDETRKREKERERSGRESV